MSITFIDVGYVWVPYIPLQVTQAGDLELFNSRIKDHQDKAKMRFSESMRPVLTMIMELSMREADRGFKPTYTETERAAWSSQLRKLVKASEEKTKADQVVYVQGEYESWE